MDAAVEIDEPLQRFQIAGPDRKWKWAEATISGNDRVIVTHPDISNPAAVRYAWSANPKGANLYNKEGFPASIFTTE
jgi:sialate O-acetylesterase